MSGFVAVEMYLALSNELKAYREKNKLLETEIQGLRTKCQVLEIDLVEREEQMELIYAQYKTHADQNQFLKSEMKKMQTNPIHPMQLTPSPSSLPPLTELPVFEELRESFSLEDENPEKPTFEPVPEEPLDGTIWCGPEPGSMNIPADGPAEFILEEVPSTLPSSSETEKKSVADVKKSSKNKRSKLIKSLSVPAKKMKLNLDGNSKIFACRIPPCGYVTFGSLEDHHQHLEFNHPDKPFICSRCPHATNTKVLLKAHEKSHEKNDLALREYKQGVFCKLCDITFAVGNSGRSTYKSALRKHINQFH